jgi:hypothetical protein
VQTAVEYEDVEVTDSSNLKIKYFEMNAIINKIVFQIDEIIILSTSTQILLFEVIILIYYIIYYDSIKIKGAYR